MLLQRRLRSDGRLTPNNFYRRIKCNSTLANFFTINDRSFTPGSLQVGKAVALYGPSVIWFKADEKHRWMPLLVGMVLFSLFIWFAENIGTFARAWTYPSQKKGWHMVSIHKLGAWYLLMIISLRSQASKTRFKNHGWSR